MRMGIELSSGIYVSYRKVTYVRKLRDSYEAVLVSGDVLEFHDKEAFERIKNYILLGHPVVDEVRMRREHGKQD